MEITTTVEHKRFTITVVEALTLMGHPHSSMRRPDKTPPPPPPCEGDADHHRRRKGEGWVAAEQPPPKKRSWRKEPPPQPGIRQTGPPYYEHAGKWECQSWNQTAEPTSTQDRPGTIGIPTQHNPRFTHQRASPGKETRRQAAA